MKKNYYVVWDIDIDAENELDAARQAKAIQLDPMSTANVFLVYDNTDGDKGITGPGFKTVDLDDERP